MEKIEQKKSAVDLTGLAIGIVILGIAVSVGAIIVKNVGISQITNTATRVVGSETVVPTTAGVQLANSWVKSVDLVANASNRAATLNSANYTLSINTDTGFATISNSTCKATADLCSSNWAVNYTIYNTSDVRYDIPAKAVTGLAEYGNWFKILVIVGVSAVVLAIIFMAFGKGSENESVGGTY